MNERGSEGIIGRPAELQFRDADSAAVFTSGPLLSGNGRIFDPGGLVYNARNSLA
jgi:hypothetical protein